ncbi:helix-turn-helix transcriptional regulator [Streptodolium elevatio]
MNSTGAVARAPQTVRRGELSAFLRSRRARIAPGDVGLPEGTRRRTPGLRREEVAQLAGVGVTWYTWLEQGRPIKASAHVLDAVSRTLRLDVAEREHLYLLAGIPSVSRPESMDPVRPEVQGILDHLDPLPAAVYNARWDVLAWNATYAMLFPGVAGATSAEQNVMWSIFTKPECCCPFVDPELEMPRMVASLRPAYGRHIGEPAWIAFVQRLCEASAEFAALWARQDVLVGDVHVKRLRHPEVGEIRVSVTSMTLDVPETRMNIYTTVDEESREAIARLRTVPQPRVGCPGHGYVHYRNPAFVTAGSDAAQVAVQVAEQAAAQVAAPAAASVADEGVAGA